MFLAARRPAVNYLRTGDVLEIHAYVENRNFHRICETCILSAEESTRIYFPYIP